MTRNRSAENRGFTNWKGVVPHDSGCGAEHDVSRHQPIDDDSVNFDGLRGLRSIDRTRIRISCGQSRGVRSRVAAGNSWNSYRGIFPSLRERAAISCRAELWLLELCWILVDDLIAISSMQIRLLLSQMRVPNVQVTGGKFYTLNRSTMMTTLGAAFSYVSVVIDQSKTTRK